MTGKFTLDVYTDYAEALQVSGVGINSPPAFARSLYKSGDNDQLIQQWLDNGRRLPSTNAADRLYEKYAKR